MNRVMLNYNTHIYKVVESLHVLLGLQLMVCGELYSTHKIKIING